LKGLVPGSDIHDLLRGSMKLNWIEAQGWKQA
jgi:hypothetical protein